MIESYIFEMLREKSRVIIPDFGAFLMKEEYKTDNNVTGTFVISFNDFLRFNDGLLIDYISEGEGISKDTAGRLLIEFVKKMKHEIATNGQFELFQMGILKLDEQKKVIFIQTQDPAAVPYADRLFKSRPSHPSYLDELSFQENEAAASVDYSSDNQSDNSDQGTSREPSNPEEGSHAVQSQETVMETGIMPEVAVEEVITGTTQADEKIIFNEENKVNSPTAEELKDIEKERTNFGTLVLIIILLVIAAGTALYFGGMINLPFKMPFGTDTTAVKINSNSDSLDFFAAEPENSITESSFDEDTLTAVDSLNPDETESDSIEPVTEPLPESEPQPERETINPAKNFHYVIGFSIGTQKEAEKKVNELKSRGFDASIVNQHKGFFRVAYGSYPDRQTAIEAMKSLKVSENNPQAWYLYYEKEEAAQ